MLAELYTYQAIFSHFIPAHIMVISRFLGNTKDIIGSLKNFHVKWRLFNALKKIYIYIYIESQYKSYKIPCNITIYTGSDSIQVWRFFKLYWLHGKRPYSDFFLARIFLHSAQFECGKRTRKTRRFLGSGLTMGVKRLYGVL